MTKLEKENLFKECYEAKKEMLNESSIFGKNSTNMYKLYYLTHKKLINYIINCGLLSEYDDYILNLKR